VIAASRRLLVARTAQLAAAGYVGLIWWLSSQTFRFEVLERVPMRDKGVHFAEYGTLTVLLLAALVACEGASRRARAAAAIWLTLCAGLLDELHQVFVFGRSGDLADLFADGLGALSFALVWAGVAALLSARAGRDGRALSPP
jgi:VanZ family protein